MFTKKRLLHLLATLLIMSCTVEKQDVNPFVQVKDSQFMLEGKPYYYFGANFWHGAYLATDMVKGDKDRLIRELDLLKEHQITNLRIMAATEESVFDASVSPAFQSALGEYSENLFEGLDFLLSEMDKRGMKAVLVLNNYWQWSGGMSQYINWVHGTDLIDPDKTGDWDGFQFQSARFYTDTACNVAFEKYIRTLVNRTNSVTGKLYKNDPTIMAWQLANEPRPAPDAAINPDNAVAYIEWVNQVAGYIQQIDTNHLVSTGSEGIAGSRESRAIYTQAHATSNIDYLTFHIWPKNWGWFNVANPSVTFDTAINKTINYFAEHLEIARELNKPTVLEEFGLERDYGTFSPDSSTTYRDRYLELLFASVVDSAKAGTPMAGLNFWAWGGEGVASHTDFMWRKGDSFMGDPPQEPQGLNSVFSSDTSTLQIFKKYNRKLIELSKPN